MASSAIQTVKTTIAQTFKRYFKKPWEFTGPCSSPEYKPSVPGALEYRVQCPASVKLKAIIPCSEPEHVFDIKYYTRDPRGNRPPIRRTIWKKSDVVAMMNQKTFDVEEFPKVYLVEALEEDYSARGGGYT